MLDIRLIREQPEYVRKELERAGSDFGYVDRVLALDEERRRLETIIGEMRNRRNVGSKQIGAIKAEEEREQLKSEMRLLGDQINEMDAQLGRVNSEQQELMFAIPNLPDERVPVGHSEADNVIVRSGGEPRSFGFNPKPHWEIGSDLGILDIERGVKISGSRFYVLKGLGAALQRALIAWFLDVHVSEHGYTEIYPPFVVKRECLVGTGQLPKFEDNQYHDVEDDLWLVPTAEVPVTNMHREELMDAQELPKSYVAYTPCFRREKMSAGRDVRGIKRGHQFDKVELVKICTPETSEEEHQSLLLHAEEMCRRLELPYRIALVCTAEKGEFNRLQYDIEVHAPACGAEGGEWLEVSSCSNFGDYQARRANIRFRPEGGGKPEFAHTINGSALALPRVMIAILENFQNEDGGLTIPPVLRPYLRGLDRITA